MSVKSGPQPAPPLPQSYFPIGLVPQTGMPSNYTSRSKELYYDTLLHEPLFMSNPFGPQILAISRPNHHW
jgi:hypothetical protein